MTCGGINMEEMSIQSMCACAASVREMSTSETTPSLIRISSTPGSPFNRERALSIWGRVTTPTSSRTLSTYCSLCCTGWGRKLGASLSQNRWFSSERGISAKEPKCGRRGDRSGIIPRLHSLRDCAAYRRPGPIRRPDDRREAEAGSP